LLGVPGTLGDPIGYPRFAQLGAQIALAAIASGAGDGFTRIIEPLAQLLAVGLAVSRIRAGGTSSAVWAILLVVTAFALALAPTDPLPCWTAVGLIVALYTTLGDPEPPPLPLAVIAGALIALRYELAPIAAVAVTCAWWRRRDVHRATAILIGGAFAVVFPFVIARVAAWRSVPELAHAETAGERDLAVLNDSHRDAGDAELALYGDDGFSGEDSVHCCNPYWAQRPGRQSQVRWRGT
jgi:hypothetical protein